MRKIFKTIIVASLATLAMPLSASTMQTYTASSDSIDRTVTSPIAADEDEEEGYDSDNSEDKSASLFNTEKFTLKQSGIRAYIAFRL